MNPYKLLSPPIILPTKQSDIAITTTVENDANNPEQPRDSIKAGKRMQDLFKVLGLGIVASRLEMNVQFRKMTRVYHPDKYNTEQAS